MHHKHECGCEHHGHHGDRGHGMASHHGGGCCCSGGFSGRHFYTSEEMIAHLEKYLEQLKAEVKGVEEHLEQLKTSKPKS